MAVGFRLTALAFIWPDLDGFCHSKTIVESRCHMSDPLRPNQGGTETHMPSLEEGALGEKQKLIQTETKSVNLEGKMKGLSHVPQQTLMAGACFCLASGGMVRPNV